MGFKEFLNEAASLAGAKLHVLSGDDEDDLFKEVSKLNIGDFYVPKDMDECFGWWEGKFNLILFPVTHNKEFFEHSIEQVMVYVDFVPDYSIDVDETPTGFNSNTGHISYQTDHSIDGVNLKNSDFDVGNHIQDDKDFSEEARAEYVRCVELVKSVNNKNVLPLLLNIQKEIDAEIYESQDRIDAYLTKKAEDERY